MMFTHTALRSNELRLLQPVSFDNQNLRFQVLHFSREVAPSYTAISYTWGDDDATQRIFLDGKMFPVRLNLCSCLFYMSLAAREASWEYIWVDAICINQSNGPERNSQVRLMDETYCRAACVSVWLGLVPAAEEYMNYSLEPIKTFDSEELDWADSMANLANRPYWSRFWVIQEFLLGRDVQLYCSGNRIDWLTFQDILGRETNVDFLSSDAYRTINSTATDLYAAVPLVMGRHIDRHPEILQPLHELLVNYRKSQCKEPRDRVFALLGLIPLEERNLLERFFPDYEMSEDAIAVITLGHVALFSHEKITLDSDQLFSGIGVNSKAKRKKILKLLKRFDYLGDTTYTLLEDIAFLDELETTQSEDMDDNDEFDSNESSRPNSGKYCVVILLLVLSISGFLWSKTHEV
jgi:heterokaryon incompatibility protein (HET)